PRRAAARMGHGPGAGRGGPRVVSHERRPAPRPLVGHALRAGPPPLPAHRLPPDRRAHAAERPQPDPRVLFRASGLTYTPPPRGGASGTGRHGRRDRRDSAAPARPRVPAAPRAAAAERARGARVRGGGLRVLDLLPLPGGRGVPLGGGGRPREPALAAALAPRHGHRAHVGAQGFAAGEEARLLRQAPPEPAGPRGARRVPGLLRARAGPAARA